MLLLSGAPQSRPELLDSQITGIECLGHVPDVLGAMLTPEKSSLRQLAGFLQVKKSGRNGIRRAAERMKRGRDVPECLRDGDVRDGHALSFMEWLAHLVRGLQQTHTQLSHFSEHDNPETLGGGRVGHFAVGSLYLPLPHGDTNGSEYRQHATNGLYPGGPFDACLGGTRVIRHQCPGKKRAETEAHRANHQRILAEFGPFHLLSIGCGGPILLQWPQVRAR